MKLYRRTLYVAVTALTLVIGLGMAANERRINAAGHQLTGFPTPTPPIEPEVTESDAVALHPEHDEADAVFDPTGDYVQDIDKLPAEFADTEYLTLEVMEYYEENGEFRSRPMVPRGSVYGKREFKLSRIAFVGRELAFTTRTVGGVSYRFVGQFTDWKNYTGDEELPSLTGKLIKIKNGKWAAAMEAKFYIQHGC